MKREYAIAGGITLALIIGLVVHGLWHDAQLKPFDASEWLAKSLATAKKENPAARLISVSAYRISPDGLVQVDERHARLTAHFRDSGTIETSPVPVPGASYHAVVGCSGGEVTTEVTGNFRGSSFKHEWSVTPQECLPVLANPPRCSFTQVWTKAKRGGAPENGYADVVFAPDPASGGLQGRWHFEIRSRPDNQPESVVFQAYLPDDC